MIAVARRCEAIGKILFKYDETRCRELFTMGLINDIGYEWGNNRNHNLIGGNLLQNMGYCFAQAIKDHGKTDPECDTDELFILNLADMTTDGKGKYVTLTERLEDISERYGEESVQTKDAEKVITKLRIRLDEFNNSFAESLKG